MKKKDKKKYVGILKNVGCRNDCPMCKGKEWVVSGYSGIAVNERIKDVFKYLNGKHIRHIILVCNNCGFMSNHATEILEEE